ncbi:cytochrome P450 [Mycena olivaceomarginata]|nr:cytochrome P450 [Mycena olivaceomarginata]
MNQTGVILLAAAGYVSWLFLHRSPQRGDHVVIAFGALIVCFYAGALLKGSDAPLTFAALGFVLYAFFTIGFTLLYRVSPWHKLAHFPGPLLWRTSSLPLVYFSFLGKRPDSLSIKRKSANTIIYGAGTHMEKSDLYVTPGHLPAVALFFKAPTRELHTERKKVWSPAFTGASIANFIPHLENRTWELLNCIERRQEASPDGCINMAKAYSHWAYDFTVSEPCDMLFGGCVSLNLMESGDPDGMVEGGHLATGLLDSLGQSPWIIDLAWHLPIGESQVRLRDEAAVMVEKRVREDSEITMRDVVSYFLSADEHVRPSLEDMKLDAVIGIEGGSDNVSIMTSLASFYLLSTEGGRKQWAKLRDEVDKAFPDPLGSLSFEVLGQLPFLNAVIHETLRLGSPFYAPRIVGKGGVIVDEEFIPEGVCVAIAGHSLQISPDNFYPDPKEFRAERWLPGGLGPGSITDRSVLYSFSSGPHMCIGKALAHQEMRLVLARLVLAFDFEFAPDFDADRFRTGVLPMRTTLFTVPLRMRARRRPGVTLLEGH